MDASRSKHHAIANEWMMVTAFISAGVGLWNGGQLFLPVSIMLIASVFVDGVLSELRWVRGSIRLGRSPQTEQTLYPEPHSNNVPGISYAPATFHQTREATSPLTY